MAEMETGRCTCGKPVSRVKALEWVARLGRYLQPASEWRHNDGSTTHRPFAMPESHPRPAAVMSESTDPGPAGPRPFGVPLAGQCTAATAPASRQCGAAAMWSLPEHPVRHAHRWTLPLGLEEVRRERVRRWHGASPALWQRIVAEVPA